MLPTQQADPCLGTKALFFSVRSYQDTAEQDKAGLMKAKQKEKKGKGKGKRPEFRCTDLWFDMYSSAELEFVNMLFLCLCLSVFVSSELSFNIPNLQVYIHWDLLSLLRSGAVFKCCCWSSCMQTLGYQVPTGYTRGPTTYLTY